jgi:hypothetical protein
MGRSSYTRPVIHPLRRVAGIVVLVAMCGGPAASLVCAALCGPTGELATMAGHAAMSCHKAASTGSRVSGTAAAPQCVDHDAVLTTSAAFPAPRGEHIDLRCALLPAALEGVRPEIAARGAPPPSSAVLPPRPSAAGLVLRI